MLEGQDSPGGAAPPLLPGPAESYGETPKAGAVTAPPGTGVDPDAGPDHAGRDHAGRDHVGRDHAGTEAVQEAVGLEARREPVGKDAGTDAGPGSGSGARTGAGRAAPPGRGPRAAGGGTGTRGTAAPPGSCLRDTARRALEGWLDHRSGEVGGDPLAAQHRWTLLPPGKLLRPVLLLESAAAVGGAGAVHRAEPVAAGLELMHAGSLVHDDIIDGDELRRGRAATHCRFGVDRAVIGADALFFAVFETLGEARSRGVPDRRIADATAVVAEAGLAITRGATMELDLSGEQQEDPGRDTDSYLEMARLKTAALLRAACRLGALLADGTAEQADALSEFGEALGIGFQIQDDLLPYADASGRRAADARGKPRTSDLRNRRPVLPLLLAHRNGGPEERRQLAGLLAGDGRPSADAADGTTTAGTAGGAAQETGHGTARETDHESAREEERQARLHRLLVATGALEAARHTSEHYFDRCRKALEVLPPTPHRDRLAELADYFSQGDK